MSPILLTRWQFTADHSTQTSVLPDGCRDLIVKIDGRGEPGWFVSPLAETTKLVSCTAGQIITGFRFHPAAQVSDRELLAAFSQCDGHESETWQIARLEEFVCLDTNLAEVLEAMANAQRKVDVARQVGVSERTLERVVKKATGQNPIFWKNLARARRTGRQLNIHQPLVELASDNGYADQAHMTREFKKWFGVTPGQFLQNPELTALVQASGYV